VIEKEGWGEEEEEEEKQEEERSAAGRKGKRDGSHRRGSR